MEVLNQENLRNHMAALGVMWSLWKRKRQVAYGLLPSPLFQLEHPIKELSHQTLLIDSTQPCFIL